MEPRRGEEGALPHKVAGPTLMLLLRQHNQKCMNMMYLIYFGFFESLACQPFCVATRLSAVASVGSTSPKILIPIVSSNFFVLPHRPSGQSITKL